MQHMDAMRALSPRQRVRSRRLRREQTEAEARLWSRLRSRQVAGAKFRRQLPLAPFVVDFCCMEVGLIVEVDGGQHSESQSDAARDRHFEATGFCVLRCWNDEVLKNIDGVCLAILREAQGRLGEG